MPQTGKEQNEMSELGQRIRDTKVDPHCVAIFWLSGGGFAFKTARGKIVFADPYLSDSANRVFDLVRMVPIPMSPTEVKADYVAITHDHLDHLDPDTLTPMAQASEVKFIGPLPCIHHLRLLKIPRDRMIELNAGQSKEIEEGLTIAAIHAEHPLTPAVGFVFDFDGVRVYLSGDTRYDKRLEEVAGHHPDVALICANGKPDNEYINLNADEAALLVKGMGAKVAIPMHYGLFAATHNDPQLFVDAMKRHDVPAKCVVMDFMGCYVYSGSVGGAHPTC
jgi:L-ascorbate 6-phosphate lactonase